MTFSYNTSHLIMNLFLHQLFALVQIIGGVDYAGHVREPVSFDRTQPMIFENDEQPVYHNSKNSQNNERNALNDTSPNLRDKLESIRNFDNISVRMDFQDDAYPQDRKFQNNMQNSMNTTKFDFDRFPRYAEIVEFMHELANRSKYAKIITIGNSFEGRPILGLRLETSKENPTIFIDAGIHAREWAAPVVALFIMKKIVDYEEILAKKLTIYVIPLANPDGYEYSHTDDRFWRKTRSKRKNSRCVGVDINRNFDSYWGVYGVQKNPCSALFPGYAPFTEPESIALRDIILRIKPEMYLTFHSYGPLLLYPWGFTHALPKNWRELDNLGQLAAATLKKINGQDYIIGSSTNVLYMASGGSDDWAMQKANVSLVYTMELPNYGQGFVVPVEKIKPMVKETFAAFIVFMKYVCSKYHSNCN